MFVYCLVGGLILVIFCQRLCVELLRKHQALLKVLEVYVNVLHATHLNKIVCILSCLLQAQIHW